MLINVFILNLQVTVENFIRILTGKVSLMLSNQVIFTCTKEQLALLAAQRLLIQSIKF